MSDDIKNLVTDILYQPEIHKLLAECDKFGNIEYKLRLDKKDLTKKENMVSQMLWRLNEGRNQYGKYEAHYILGILDDGNFSDITENELNTTLNILKSIAKKANAKIVSDKTYVFQANKMIIHAIVRKDHKNLHVPETNLMIMGPVNVGKSSLMSRLCHGQKDDGNGFSRKLVLRHIHEKTSGNTSSTKYDTIGFSGKNIINYELGIEFNMENIYNSSDRLINLIDIPGDFKYLKTIMYSVSSIRPENIVICISCKLDNIHTHTETNTDIDLRILSVDQSLLSVDPRLLSVDQSLLSVDQRLLSVDPRLLSVDQRLLSVDQRLLSVDQSLLSVDPRLLSVNRDPLTECFDREKLTKQKQQKHHVNETDIYNDMKNFIYNNIDMYKFITLVCIVYNIQPIFVLTKLDMINNKEINYGSFIASIFNEWVEEYLINNNDIMNNKQKLDFNNSPFIKISHVTDQGYVELIEELSKINIFNYSSNHQNIPKLLNVPPNVPMQDGLDRLFVINESFTIPDTGTIFHGTMKHGTIDVDDEVDIFSHGQIIKKKVKSIHRKTIDVDRLFSNESGSIIFYGNINKNIDKTSIIIAPSWQNKIRNSSRIVPMFKSQKLKSQQFLLFVSNNIVTVFLTQSDDEYEIICQGSSNLIIETEIGILKDEQQNYFFIKFI